MEIKLSAGIWWPGDVAGFAVEAVRRFLVADYDAQIERYIDVSDIFEPHFRAHLSPHFCSFAPHDGIWCRAEPRLLKMIFD